MVCQVSRVRYGRSATDKEMHDQRVVELCLHQCEPSGGVRSGCWLTLGVPFQVLHTEVLAFHDRLRKATSLDEMIGLHNDQ